jgi:hypothetical protein
MSKVLKNWNLLKQKMALNSLKEQLSQEIEEKLRKEMEVMIQNRLVGLNLAQTMDDLKAEDSRETQSVILKHSNFFILFDKRNQILRGDLKKDLGKKSKR